MKALYLLIIGLLAVSSAGFAQESVPERTDFSKFVTLYPNPSTDYIHIRFNTVNAENAKVSLYTILGNEIAVESEVIGSHIMRIWVKDLPTGYYLLAISDDQSHFKGTYKFLKR
jgi:hypothetical protein